MRFTILCAFSFAVGCSSGGAKTVHVSAAGQAAGLVRAGDHVAYLLNISSGLGGTGELHVASSTGSDVKIASGISADAYLFTSDGSALFYTQINSGAMDASLYWVDIAHGGSPKQLFAHGLRVAANNPDNPSGSGTHAAPLIQQGFFSPSGKYFIVGVLPPNINSSSDMHVIESATGNDIYQRVNGAFAYLELVLPDDTMVFQDSENAVNGIAGPPPVEHLYWVKLPGASGMNATAIDDRVANFVPTSDNKFIIYQKSDRTLLAWDASAHPAAGTMLATGTVQFVVGSNIVAYTSGDGSLHVIGVDGSKKADIAAGADAFSPLVLSSDGADLYFFQKVETQSGRGTLMHVAASGGTPTKIDMNASLYDVRPVPGGLLYLRNVDQAATLGDLVRAARDGSGGNALATGVPIGINVLEIVGKDQNWIAPHLVSAMLNPKQTLVDGTSATTGTLALASMSGETKIEPQTRLGDYALDGNDDQTLVFIGGIKLDTTVNNYVGTLKWVPAAMPSMMPATITLDSVSELTPVSKRGFFANSTGMTSPGVYYVTY